MVNESEVLNGEKLWVESCGVYMEGEELLEEANKRLANAKEISLQLNV